MRHAGIWKLRMPLCGWILLFVGYTTGCAHVAVRVDRPVARSLKAGQEVILVVDNPLVGVKGSVPAQDQLMWRLGEELQRHHVRVRVARQLPETPLEATTVVVVQLEHFRHVRPRDRFWYGGFAGRAEINVIVRVFELNVPEPVAVFRITSATGTHVFAGTDNEAVNEAVHRIARQLLFGH